MKWIATTRPLREDRGIGLVNAMFVLSLLAMLAVIAAGMAVNEKRTAFNDKTYVNAFISADSGGEEAIAWLRSQDSPPIFQDFDNAMQVVKTTETGMDAYSADQRYDYAIRMRSGAEGQPVVPRDGYMNGFADWFYVVESHGQAGTEGKSSVNLMVSRLALGGYNQ